MLARSPEHEVILTSGFGAEVGGIGPARVAERISTFAPGLLFGKGLGDLPDSLKYLRPLSINGQLQVNIPSHRRTVTTSINEDGDIEQDIEHHPTTIPFGFAIMYSIPYLQSFVKDVGLTAPLANLFPVVEFNFETPVSGPGKKLTTAFANPGIIWVGRYVELGLEAQLPMNKVSGKNAGINGLIHIFIDDLLPNIFTWTPGGVIGPTPIAEMRSLKKKRCVSFWLWYSARTVFQTLAQAHAFPVRSDPRVGWTVAVSPPKVTIWFDGELEPAFSTITVYNSAKQQVDKGNSRVNGPDASVLEVDLTPLAPGTYHVYWKALAKDTHVTQGDFTFAVDKK